MLNFNDVFAQMMNGYAEPNAVVQVIPVNQRFEEFKQFVVQYVQEHDNLDPNHQTIQQILNLGSNDEIEQILRHNHEYCDDCLLKMYRKFASGEPQDQGCGCGG